jgi:hypothetical protein
MDALEIALSCFQYQKLPFFVKSKKTIGSTRAHVSVKYTNVIVYSKHKRTHQTSPEVSGAVHTENMLEKSHRTQVRPDSQNPIAPDNCSNHRRIVEYSSLQKSKTGKSKPWRSRMNWKTASGTDQ